MNLCKIENCQDQKYIKGYCIKHYTKLRRWGNPLADMMTGSNSHHWKGDNVSYSGIHKWIAKMLGVASYCENCGTTTSTRFEWANLSGQYIRDISDWASLCVVCHRLIDDNIRRGWKTRRMNYAS